MGRSMDRLHRGRRRILPSGMAGKRRTARPSGHSSARAATYAPPPEARPWSEQEWADSLAGLQAGRGVSAVAIMLTAEDVQRLLEATPK